jgi:hypothetical protein
MAESIGRLGHVFGAALILLSSGAAAADPSSRAEAVAAADAAAGLPSSADAGVPVCAAAPPSGEKLAGDIELGAEGHSIEVANAGGGDALVNIRHAGTRKLATRFYLRSGEQTMIEGVPDGDYLIQYAFGPALAPDCKTFTRIIRARELPDHDQLKTETIDNDDQTSVKHDSVSYELSVTEDANVKPVKIDAAAFNAE